MKSRKPALKQNKCGNLSLSCDLIPEEIVGHKDYTGKLLCSVNRATGTTVCLPFFSSSSPFSPIYTINCFVFCLSIREGQAFHGYQAIEFSTT